MSSDSPNVPLWPIVALIALFVSGIVATYLLTHRERSPAPLDSTEPSVAAGWDGGVMQRPSRTHDTASASAPALIPDSRVRVQNSGEEDPQMRAMRRSFRIEEGVADAGVALPFLPMVRRARVATAEGSVPVERGELCDIRVLPVRTQSFNCLARVMCGDRVLYPNPAQTAGYVPCHLEGGRPDSARDTGHTARDGDPLLDLDVGARRVTVQDRGAGVDEFEVELEII